jgi:hypothetical protein
MYSSEWCFASTIPHARPTGTAARIEAKALPFRTAGIFITAGNRRRLHAEKLNQAT